MDPLPPNNTKMCKVRKARSQGGNSRDPYLDSHAPADIFCANHAGAGCNHISNPFPGHRGNGCRPVTAVHGVKGAYLAVVLALDELAFILLRRAVTVVLDPLHCQVVGAGWVRV